MAQYQITLDGEIVQGTFQPTFTTLGADQAELW